MQQAKSDDRQIDWMVPEAMPLVRVRTGRGITAMRVGMVHGYYVHWVQSIKRTQPCILGGCKLCEAGEPRRPLGYMAAAAYLMRDAKFDWRRCILELPHRCAILVAELPPEPLAFRRDRNFGPVNIGKFWFKYEAPRFEPFEIVKDLMAMWRVPAGTPLALIGNLGPIHD